MKKSRQWITLEEQWKPKKLDFVGCFLHITKVAGKNLYPIL